MLGLATGCPGLASRARATSPGRFVDLVRRPRVCRGMRAGAEKARNGFTIG